METCKTYDPSFQVIIIIIFNSHVNNQKARFSPGAISYFGYNSVAWKSLHQSLYFHFLGLKNRNCRSRVH